MPPRDYRIFIGAFLTGELAERLQSVQAHYDPPTAHITPPHVTLAGTYWRAGPATPQNEATLIARLHSVPKQIAPFTLMLGGIYTFPLADHPVIYLGVELSPELLAARRILLAVMGEAERQKPQRFTPHLTLAMRLAEAAAQQMIQELQESEWATSQRAAPISELKLMQRGPQDPAWRTLLRMPLLGQPSAGRVRPAGEAAHDPN